MKQNTVHTLWNVGLVASLAAAILAGCGGEAASSAQADSGASGTYTSSVLDTSYAHALSVSDQLALGTIQLEETDQAVTPEQATALLPLWQALRGGVTDQLEVNAVLKQIEGTMDPEQLQAIAAMQLTQESLQSWMEEQGPGSAFPGGFGGFGDVSEEERAALQATAEAGGFPNGFGGSGDMSDEERAALRETAQAGGGFRGGGQGFGGMSEEQRAALQATVEAGGGSLGGSGGFGNMSDEERSALRETAQAGGGFAGGRRGAAGGSAASLVGPLIQLLQARASGT